MGPWSFVAPRFEKQLACKVSSGSNNIIYDMKPIMVLNELLILHILDRLFCLSQLR